MKVVIIGAGATGLYLAWKLSEKKNEVFVFERKEKVGGKACSGLFSERIFEFVPESKKLIKNEINFCKIHFPKKTIFLHFKRRFFVFDRSEFDNLLKNLAENFGTKIFFNKNITHSDLQNFLKEFDRILGCDGANSTVRDFLKLPKPKFYLGIKGIAPPEHVLAGENFVETWPTKDGFLWKIPRGKEIEWGIMEEPKFAKEIFENFLKRQNLKLEKIEAAIIPQGFIIPKNEKITLCGDAAGLTKPWSGGGVIWGLMSANLLLKNFPDFLKYQKEMKKLFSLNFTFSKLAKKLVYFLGFNFPYLLPKNFKIDGDFLF
jgi:electron-transferring-flavoprotein dehydrogenase